MRFGRDHDRNVAVADAVGEERGDGLEQLRVLAVELNGMPYVGDSQHVNQRERSAGLAQVGPGVREAYLPVIAR
jgi:hypothetical protein